jgi:hypothetical protein
MLDSIQLVLDELRETQITFSRTHTPMMMPRDFMPIWHEHRPAAVHCRSNLPRIPAEIFVKMPCQHAFRLRPASNRVMIDLSSIRRPIEKNIKMRRADRDKRSNMNTEDVLGDEHAVTVRQ